MKRVEWAFKYGFKKSALKYILRDPTILLSLSSTAQPQYFAKTIQKALRKDFVPALYEFLPREFRMHLRDVGFEEAAYHQYHGMVIYLLVRIMQPDVIVETGVGPEGTSSAFALCAMHENSYGHLYSIDLPPAEASVEERIDNGLVFHTLEDGVSYAVPDSGAIGRLVPHYLKSRWTLIHGDAREELPRLLKNIGTVSIFSHDSLHTYNHMMFEFREAWPHIRKDGFLIAHDVLMNDSFWDFSHNQGLRPVVYHSLGILRKEQG